MAKDFLSDVDFKSTVTLTSTDAGSSAAPILELYRNSASPADADYIGQIKFQGENDNDQKVVYAKITGKIDDASDTSEDGIIEVAHQKAGSNNISARFTSSALKLINGTGLEIADGLLTLGSTAVTSTAAELNILDGVTSTTAELNILDGVTSTTAELNILDGCIANSGGLNALASITFGAVAANKAVTADGNLDVASFRNVTLTGELDAATLDISGNADIDGTANLDDVDIDGTVQIDGATTFGVDDTGVDVKFFGATSGKYMLWDESADALIVKDTVDAVNFKVNGGQGSDGQVLTSTGSGVAWENAAGGSPGGSNTQIQFNNSSSFGGSANLTFDGTNLTLAGDATIGDTLILTGTAVSHISNNTSANREVLQFRGKTSLSDGAGMNLYGDGDSTHAGKVKMWTNNTERFVLDASGNFQLNGTLTTGVDDTGYDVVFYGATAGDKWKWDESSDAMLVEGHSFLEKKVQTGATSFTQEPWANSTIALGNYGSIGTQGSYRTYMSWNYERGTDSNFHHLDVNSYPQAGHVAIGNSGILFGYDDDFETTHTANPATRVTIDATGLSAINGTAANPSIAFTGDRDCGLYYTTEDNGSSTVAVVAIATDGTVRATFGDDIADMKSAKIKTTDVIQGNEFRASDTGPESDPSFTFVDDGDTGWYRYAANSLGAAVGGNNVWYVTDAGNNVWKTHTNATAYNYMLGASHSILYMGGHDSTSMGGVYVTSSGYLYTRAGDAWRTRQSSGEFRPYYDSAMTLGSSSARWVQLYADTATISTSDVNLKTDIVDTTLGLDFIKALRPISYKWKKTDGGKDGVRDHQGFIAQEVKTLLDAQSGTDASKQALWVDFSVSGKEEQLPDHDDPEKMVTVPAPTDQALRYEELIAPMVKAIQELEARVASLES